MLSITFLIVKYYKITNLPLTQHMAYIYIYIFKQCSNTINELEMS